MPCNVCDDTGTGYSRAVKTFDFYSYWSYNQVVQITYDPAKSERNIADRNLSFALVEQLDWLTALIEEDTRKAYGERRFFVLGYVGERLHAVVFTPRAGKPHVISLRKANSREVKRYEKTSKP